MGEMQTELGDEAKAQMAALKKQAKEIFPGKSSARKRREWITKQGKEVCRKRKRGEDTSLPVIGATGEGDMQMDVQMDGAEEQDGGKEKKEAVAQMDAAAVKNSMDLDGGAFAIGSKPKTPKSGPKKTTRKTRSSRKST